MLWPLILPFQITVALMIALLIAVLWFGARRKWRSGRKISAAVLLPLLLFVPSCVATSYVVDHYRFGMFHYDNFDSIHDFRVERYMPPAATDISVYKHPHGNGYRARFTISEADFDAWHTSFWEKYAEYAINSRDDDNRAPSSSRQFDQWFGEFNWSMPGDCVQYHSPVAGNGAHYTVQYSPDRQQAFLNSCYW